MDQLTTPSRPRAGRPTREQAEARERELLDCALDQFLEKGFEQATIEAIAGAVGMTKRTVYARYADKAALFLAAVNLAIERFAVSDDTIRATEVADLEQTLINIAHLRIGAVRTEQGRRLRRIVTTESYRFPEIFNAAYRITALPTIRFLADLLNRETAAGRLALDEPLKAANTFMSMVVGGPVAIIESGNELSDEEIGDRVSYAVRLFLNGARPR